MEKYEWKDVVITLGGKKIETKPIEWGVSSIVITVEIMKEAEKHMEGAHTPKIVEAHMPKWIQKLIKKDYFEKFGKRIKNIKFTKQ
jgi:hypothetical protein